MRSRLEWLEPKSSRVQSPKALQYGMMTADGRAEHDDFYVSQAAIKSHSMAISCVPTFCPLSDKELCGASDVLLRLGKVV